MDIRVVISDPKKPMKQYFLTIEKHYGVSEKFRNAFIYVLTYNIYNKILHSSEQSYSDAMMPFNEFDSVCFALHAIDHHFVGAVER